MKTKLIAIAISLMFTSVSYAEDVNEVCGILHETATMVMKMRQEGAPMPQMMQLSDSDLARAIVQEAYEEPQYHSDEVKARSIQNFANKIAASCYKALQW